MCIGKHGAIDCASDEPEIDFSKDLVVIHYVCSMVDTASCSSRVEPLGLAMERALSKESRHRGSLFAARGGSHQTSGWSFSKVSVLLPWPLCTVYHCSLVLSWWISSFLDLLKKQESLISVPIDKSWSFHIDHNRFHESWESSRCPWMCLELWCICWCLVMDSCCNLFTVVILLCGCRGVDLTLHALPR